MLYAALKMQTLKRHFDSNKHLEDFLRGTAGSCFHNFAFCLIGYTELSSRGKQARCVTTGLFYF